MRRGRGPICEVSRGGLFPPVLARERYRGSRAHDHLTLGDTNGDGATASNNVIAPRVIWYPLMGVDCGNSDTSRGDAVMIDQMDFFSPEYLDPKDAERLKQNSVLKLVVNYRFFDTHELSPGRAVPTSHFEFFAHCIGMHYTPLNETESPHIALDTLTNMRIPNTLPRNEVFIARSMGVEALGPTPECNAQLLRNLSVYLKIGGRVHQDGTADMYPVIGRFVQFRPPYPLIDCLREFRITACFREPIPVEKPTIIRAILEGHLLLPVC